MPDEKKEYYDLELSANELQYFTGDPQFKRIYAYLMGIKKSCQRPDCDVDDKKELDRIHAIYEMINSILTEIARPITEINEFLDNTKNTLFEQEVNSYFRWDAEKGIVISTPNLRSMERKMLEPIDSGENQ